MIYLDHVSVCQGQEGVGGMKIHAFKKIWEERALCGEKSCENFTKLRQDPGKSAGSNCDKPMRMKSGPSILGHTNKKWVLGLEANQLKPVQIY